MSAVGYEGCPTSASAGTRLDLRDLSVSLRPGSINSLVNDRLEEMHGMGIRADAAHMQRSAARVAHRTRGSEGACTVWNPTLSYFSTLPTRLLDWLVTSKEASNRE